MVPARSRVDATDSETISCAFGSNFQIEGASASSGRSSRSRCIRQEVSDQICCKAPRVLSTTVCGPNRIRTRCSRVTPPRTCASEPSPASASTDRTAGTAPAATKAPSHREPKRHLNRRRKRQAPSGAPIVAGNGYTRSRGRSAVAPSSSPSSSLARICRARPVTSVIPVIHSSTYRSRSSCRSRRTSPIPTSAI